jgi:hypothetical protein
VRGLHIKRLKRETNILAMIVKPTCLTVFIWLMCLATASLFAQEVLPERLHLRTDRSVYHAGEMMWFSIAAFDGATRKPLDLSKVAYLELLDSANMPVAQSIVGMKQAHGDGSLLIPDVKPGVYLLVAYTNWMKNFGPDYFVHKEVAIVNGRLSAVAFALQTPNAASANNNAFGISSDKHVYRTRERVSLSLDSIWTRNRMSLSVYRTDSLTPPAYFGAENNGTRDNLRLPSGQRILFPPEYNGRILKGRITDRATGAAATGVNVFLTVPGASGFYNSVSDDEGGIKFEITNVTNTDSMIVQAEQRGGRSYVIDMEDPFYKHAQPVTRDMFIVAADRSNTLTDLFVNTQVRDVYDAEHLAKRIDRSRDTSFFFGKPDFTYQLDDYTRFSKMEEVFREYVAPVAVNRLGSRFILKVFAPGQHATYAREPLVLIDGYPVADINTLFAFDPLKVKKIDVVNKRYVRSGAVFDGIVYLTTYSGDLNGYPVDSAALIIRDQVITGGLRLSSPVYDSETKRSSRLPDFRNVLYWNPAVDTNEISFYTSDVPGTYVAVLQGLSENGEVINASVKFQVKE